VYKAPRGTTDILPREQPCWQYIEEKAAQICRLYGYERIETPVFEETQLFTRSVGEGTDIVEKEMYTFEDKGGNMLTLKPEGTAPVCRAYIEHGMHNLSQPVKLYYITPIFRYERPQSGRYREHHQFGYEAIGELDPALDAEVIEMAWQLYLSLGLTRLSLQLNSIGCKECRPVYLAALKEYYAGHAGNLCPDCQARMVRNPLRLLDCKNPQCQAIADAAPKSVDYLCGECAEHFTRLKEFLSLVSIPFDINHRLVRGLDYYTKTVFEIQPEIEGGQSTIGGGGRYDDLIAELGGPPTPALGFATGIERIVLNLKQANITVPAPLRPQVFIACAGAGTKNAAIALAARLRRQGIGVIEALGAKSLKAQLRQANTLGVGYTVIIGEAEIQSGTAVLRDMTSAQQQNVNLADLERLLGTK
jgi:histidyl-tRNA synthetase